jgi:hypothetical protein
MGSYVLAGWLTGWRADRKRPLIQLQLMKHSRNFNSVLETITKTTTAHRPITPKTVVQWSKGEYAGASNTQDDLALISRHLAVRSDDHGGSPASATDLQGAFVAGSPGRSSASAAGAIERTGDSDWFTFEAAAGAAAVTVDLVPDATIKDLDSVFVRSDADLRLQIFGPLPPGAVAGPADDATLPPLVAEFDPRGDLLTGASAVKLPADGRYYVSLTGAGDGDAATNGYSSYGSLGEYRITVDYATPTASDGNDDDSSEAAPGDGGPAGALLPSEPDTEGRVRVKVRCDVHLFAGCGNLFGFWLPGM